MNQCEVCGQEHEQDAGHVAAIFSKVIQLNGVMYPQDQKVQVSEDWWLSEGHRHGTLVPKEEAHAVQERRTEEEIPRDGGSGGDQQKGGGRVRQGQQGDEAPREGQVQGVQEEGILSNLLKAQKARTKKGESK